MNSADVDRSKAPLVGNPESFQIGSWSHTTTLIEKIPFLVQAVESLSGVGHSFSLNLARSVADRAAADTEWLFRLIRRHLGKRPVVIALGLADGRLHCHGAISCADADDINMVRQALLRAGGRWESSRGAVYQVKLGPITEAFGWGAYLRQNVNEARAGGITGPLWSATHELRRHARRRYEEIRERANIGPKGHFSAR